MQRRGRQYVAGMGSYERNRRHVRGTGRSNPDRSIFDHDALARRNAEPLGGEQKAVRRGLAAEDVEPVYLRVET